MTRDTVKPSFLASLLPHCERHHYPIKGVVIRPGAPADVLYYIVDGAVYVSIENVAGREIVLAHLGAGNFLGESGLFHEQMARNVWVRAREPCELAEISYQRLRLLARQELAADYADILFTLAAQMAIRLRSASRKVHDLAFLDVSSRIINALRELVHSLAARQHARGRQVSVTQQELGRIVGCSREMAGRVLKDLQRRELIEISGRLILVFDHEEDKPLADAPTSPIFSLV